MHDDLPTISTSRLAAADIPRRTFGAVRRGFDPQEVRAYLDLVAKELVAAERREQELLHELAAAEERARHPEIDEALLTSALGQRSAALLRSAHDEAARIIEHAERTAAALVREAQQHASEAEVRAESSAAERIAEAELGVNALRQQARDEAAAILEASRVEGESVVEHARQQGRSMIEQAQEARRRVLAEMAQRRRVLSEQIEQFRAARDELASAVLGVRHSLDRIVDDLGRADDQARAAAADAARHSHGEVPESVLAEEGARAAAEAGVTLDAPVARNAAVEGGGATQQPGEGHAWADAPMSPAPSSRRARAVMRFDDVAAHEAGDDRGYEIDAPYDEPLVTVLAGPQASAASAGAHRPRGDQGGGLGDVAVALPHHEEPPSGRGPDAAGAVNGSLTHRAEPEAVVRAGAEVVDAQSETTRTRRSGSRHARTGEAPTGSAEEVFARLRALEVADPTAGDAKDEAPRVVAGVSVLGPDAAPSHAGAPLGATGALESQGRGESVRALATAGEVGHSVDPGTSEAPADTDAGASDGQHAEQSPEQQAIGERDALLEPIATGMARRLKRALQDDQNALLDRLRQGPGTWSDDLLPDEGSQRSLYAKASSGAIRDSMAAGAAFARSVVGARGRAPAPDQRAVNAVTDELTGTVVALLRRRLEGRPCRRR